MSRSFLTENLDINEYFTCDEYFTAFFEIHPISIKVNEIFIKTCRDGDLAKFADLVDRADVNYVSESGQSPKETEK